MNTEDLLAHTSFIKSLARSLVKDENIAADIAQNTYLAVLEHPPADGKFPRSWIRSVVRNIVNMMYRAEGRRKKYENRSVSSTMTLPPEEIVIRKETVHQMVDAVFNLEEPYRTTILLRYYDNLKIDEIANRMETPSGTVSGRIQRGLEILRTQLDKSCSGKRNEWVFTLAPIAGLKLSTSSSAAASGLSPLLTGAVLMPLKAKVAIVALLVLITAICSFLFLQKRFDSIVDSNSEISATESTLKDTQSTDGNPAGQSNDNKNQEKLAITPDVLKRKLIGRILAESDGKEICNARVVVNSLPFTKGNTAIEGVTDESGAFTIFFPVENTENISALHLQVYSQGYRGVATTRPFNVEDHSQSFGTIYMLENKTHSMLVVNSNYEPIEGAQVKVICDANYDEDFIVVNKRTDSIGKVQITDEELLIDMRHLALCVTALNKADHYGEISKKQPLPERIIMEEEGYWNGRVVDAESGFGIPGATVKLMIVNPRDLTYPKIKPLETDGNGYFELKRFTGWQGVITITTASGYMPAHIFRRRSPTPPELIAMESSAGFKHVQVFDVSTEQPLPDLEIQMDYYGETVTDNNGIFRYPFKYGNSKFCITTSDYERFKYECDADENKNGDIKSVYLQPMVLQNLKGKITIKLRDEIGLPIPGVAIQMYTYVGTGNMGLWEQTNMMGEAVFHPNASNGIKVTFKIRRTGFSSHYSEHNDIDFSKDTILEFVLNRGTLFQGLRVLDEFENPVCNKYIQGQVVLKDGKVQSILEKTDEDGKCNLTFPPFIRGYVFVSQRPDTAVDLTYEMISNQKNITIIFTKEIDLQSMIQGVVQDENGTPMSGAYAEIFDRFDHAEDSKYKFSDTCRVASNGTFRVPVNRSKIHKLSFSPLYRNDHLYMTKDIYNISAGANLTVTMKSYKGVIVSLLPIWKQLNPPISKNNTWLENEEGITVIAGKTVYDKTQVFFINVPPGKMRAAIEIETGKRFYTPFFELEAGKSIETKIETR